MANKRPLSDLSFDELLARSSFGTPDVRDAIALAPDAIVASIVHRVIRPWWRPMSCTCGSELEPVLTNGDLILDEQKYAYLYRCLGCRREQWVDAAAVKGCR